LSLKDSKALFYKREGQIVVIASISQQSSGSDQLQDLSIEETANPVSELELNKEHEFVLDNKAQTRKQESNVEEATYSKLYKDIRTTSAAVGGSTKSGATVSTATSKIGRNDNCPCGSGKKYKKCHGSH
jgi:uncharacterized protein YecA (UPF0149 family)